MLNQHLISPTHNLCTNRNMYDWDAFLFTDSHEIEMVYSYCHSARTDPFRQCFGVKVDKKCLYETPTMQKALGENDGGVVFEQRRRLSEQLLLKNNRDMGPGHGGARSGHGFQGDHSGQQGQGFQGQSGHH